MRNTQTGLFSGLFVIIGHNLVICTEIWSILQRTAEHFCSYCHGEKSIETDEPIVKPQNWNSKFIINISRVSTVKCIFILPCHFVIFMLWHFIVFLMLFVFWSYSVYCLVKQDNIFARNTISILYLLDIMIFWANIWHIFVEHWRSFL